MWQTGLRWQLLPLLLTVLALTLGTVVIIRLESGPDTTPAVAPRMTSPVTTVGGIPVRTLVVKPIELPPSNADLLVTAGCFGCDWPPTQLLRIHRGPANEVNVRAVLQAGAEFDGITAVAVSANGAVAVSTCAAASCEAPGARPESGKTTIRRSRDAGVTWEAPVELAGFAWVHAFAGDQVIVSRLLQVAPTGQWTTELVLIPSAAVLTPPAGTFPAARPHALSTGEILWVNQRRDAFLDSNGAVFLRPAMSASGVVEDLRRGSGDELVVSWYEIAAGSSGKARYVGRYRADGSPIAIYILPMVGGLERWAGPSTDVAPLNWPQGSDESLPGIIDVTAGTVTPIGGPFVEGEFLGGSYELWSLGRGADAQ